MNRFQLFTRVLRTARVPLLATFAALVVALVAPSAARADQVGTITLRGYNGVADWAYTSADSIVYASQGCCGVNGAPSVFVSAYRPETGERLNAYLIPGGPIAPGTYTAAGAFGTSPGLWVLHHSPAGNISCDGGTFTIHSLDLGNWYGDGFEVSWSQNCAGREVSGHANIQAVLPPDTRPPALEMPGYGFMAVETSDVGRIVDYTVTAIDDRDPNPVVVCDPPSGSYFPLGRTDVTCTATDNVGNSSSGTLQLWVIGPDVTPPLFYNAPSFDVPATSPSGARVDLYVAATDDRSDPTIICSANDGSVHVEPKSSHEFPINAVGESTLVTCTATDQADNSITTTFTVHVQGAWEQVGGLIAAISSYDLATLGTSLTDKLVTVQRMLVAGKRSQARANLDSFIAQVKTQSGNGLADWQAWQLATTAEQIKTVIGS